MRFLPGEYELIPDGIDLDHFSTSVDPIEEFTDGKLNILFVGRFEHRKGLSYLINAYQRVKVKCPESRLIIVGSGNTRRNIYKTYVEEKDLKDVVFAGRVTYDNLPRYYKTADIFCSPAIAHESFGIVLLEAMALSKPVIATNIPGHASWITNGGEGILVKPGDVDELGNALLQLLTDKSLRKNMGDRALDTAKRYDMQNVASQISAYYRKAYDKIRS
jgi:phosphatidylinositol alpha-mannosyltransferase